MVFLDYELGNLARIRERRFTNPYNKRVCVAKGWIVTYIAEYTTLVFALGIY